MRVSVVEKQSLFLVALFACISSAPTNRHPPTAKKKIMSTTETTKIPSAIVIGAGPAGLSVSLGLSHRGWKVILIEKYESFEIRGASFGMKPNGINALEEIHPGIVQRGMIEAGLTVKLPSGGLLLPWWMMRDALLEKVRERGDVMDDDASISIDLRMGLSVNEILDEGRGPGSVVQVKFTNGETIEGDVVIGADGVHSSVREFLDLPKNELTGSKVFRGSVEVQPEPQKNSSSEIIILEQLLQKGLVPLSVTYPGFSFFVLNFHPDVRGRMCWVLSTTDSTFNPEETSIQSFVEKHEKDEEKLATILAILNASSDDSLLSYTETKVSDFADDVLSQYDGRWGGKGRVTLIGDAAHAMRPIDGQGGNMAFEDAVVLCRVLGSKDLRSTIALSSPTEADASTCTTVEELLGEFERTRLPRVKKIHDNQRSRYEARMKGGKVGPWSPEFKEWVNSGV